MNLDIRPHFRAVFDIEPKTADILWGQVVRSIREWIADREQLQQSTQKFWGSWMFTGGSWQSKTSRSRIVTDRWIGAGDEGFPEHWSLRWEHPDSSVTWRWWRSDIGLTRTDTGGVRVSVLISHWLSPSFVGLEPPVPSPSSPNLVKAILNDPRWICRSGDLELNCTPRTLEVGEGHLFASLVKSNSRSCPVVYVSRRYPEGDLPLDEQRLARNLGGVAIVAVAPSSVFDKETEQLLPQALRCWGGRVRIYYPGANPSNEKRNRFFEPRYIAEVGADEVERIIIRAVVRWTLMTRSNVLTTIEDLASRRRDSRFVQLSKDLKAGAGAAELEELIRIADEQFAESKKTIAHLNSELALAESERQSQEDLAESRKQALDEAGRFRSLDEKRIADLTDKSAAVNQFSSLPKSLDEIVVRLGALFPDRLVITEEARKSARKAKINEYASEIAGLWSWGWSVATVLHDLYFAGESDDLPRRYQELTGFEFALTEGKSTKADNRFLRLREVTVDGRVYRTMAHAKYGGRGKEARMYLAPDPESKKLIIGHCGDHLETAGTRRQD